MIVLNQDNIWFQLIMSLVVVFFVIGLALILVTLWSFVFYVGMSGRTPSEIMEKTFGKLTQKRKRQIVIAVVVWLLLTILLYACSVFVPI
jgi:hypothetical protein